MKLLLGISSYLIAVTQHAIVPLAMKFLRETSDELGVFLPALDEEAFKLLVGMPWPGKRPHPHPKCR